jgi:APA family basic amino acid/polyamine antiporter
LAASAVAFATYAGRYLPQVPHEVLALSLIGTTTAFHLKGASFSSKLQIGATSLQVVMMTVLIVCGLAIGQLGRCFAPTHLGKSSWYSLQFAHALVYVTFAYSGWNAAVYVAGEIRSPARNLPRALVGATALVTVFYVLVNVIFLASAPLEELSGVLDIGAVAAQRLFGQKAALAMTLLVCAGLVSCASALTFSGARVLSAMSLDSARLSFLTPRASPAPPTRATLLQSCFASILVLTSSFEALLTYVGFMLSISTLIALLGIF